MSYGSSLLVQRERAVQKRSWTAAYLQLSVLALTTLLVFSRAFSAGYVDWDDTVFVVQNPVLAVPLAKALSVFFGHYFFGDYIPLTLLSFWAEVHAFGLNPLVQHTTNLLIHILNVALVFSYLRYWRLGPGPRALVAGLFALHPLQVEVVMWVSERKGLLAVFFALLAMHAFQRSAGDRRFRALYPALYVLSLLSKATAVLLPVLLVAEDVLIRRTSFRSALRKQYVALAIGSAWAVLRVLAYKNSVPDFGSASLSPDYWLSVPWRVLGACGFYVLKFFAPVDLSIIYPTYNGLYDVWPEVAAAVAALAVLAALLGRFKSRRLAYFAVFSVIFLLPILQLVPRINYVNDRYMYLPLIGFAAPLAALIDRRRTKALPIVALLAVAVLSAVSFARSGVWTSNYALWTDTITQVPRNSLASLNLGVEYNKQGRVQEAIRLYERAAELGKANGTAHLALNDLGVVYSSPRFPRLRDPDRAARYFLASIRAAPLESESFMARSNLAFLYRRVGREQDALRVAVGLDTALHRASDRRFDSLVAPNERLIRDLERRASKD